MPRFAIPRAVVRDRGLNAKTLTAYRSGTLPRGMCERLAASNRGPVSTLESLGSEGDTLSDQSTHLCPAS
jgi:hypothetical protein